MRIKKVKISEFLLSTSHFNGFTGDGKSPLILMELRNLIENLTYI